jgi:hypothetical protein
MLLFLFAPSTDGNLFRIYGIYYMPSMANADDAVVAPTQAKATFPAARLGPRAV